MRLLTKRTVVDFWIQNPDAEKSLRSWCDEVAHASWHGPAEVKAKYGSASIVGNSRVVFNICGNKYRLIASINYAFGRVYIKFLGTHEEYDQIDAETVQ